MPQREFPGGVAEIFLACRLDPPDLGPQLHDIEIEFQNPLLAQPVLQPPGGERLLHFAERIARGREIEILGQLLADRARAANPVPAGPGPAQHSPQLRAIPRIGPVELVATVAQRLPDLLVVDPGVLVEPVVLRDQHRAAHHRSDLLSRHRLVEPPRRRTLQLPGLQVVPLLPAAHHHKSGLPRPDPAIPHRGRPHEPEPGKQDGEDRQEQPSHQPATLRRRSAFPAPRRINVHSALEAPP